MKQRPEPRAKNAASRRALDAARSSPSRLVAPAEVVGTSPQAAAKALSRLAAEGKLVRMAKGLYYAPKQTPLGESRPSPAAVLTKSLEGRVRLTGASAANALGLSTQVPARPEYVVYTSGKAPELSGIRLKVRRGTRKQNLKTWQGALLEVLRDGGEFIELSSDEAIDSLVRRLREADESGTLSLLVTAVAEEPPRVRAILGALLEEAGLAKSAQQTLKSSLNPYSRFDFGIFRGLQNAREWQAK